MKCLSINFQPNRVPELDAAAVLFNLRALAAGWAEGLNVEQGDEDGPYANVTYSVRDLAAFWAHLQAEMNRNPTVSAAITRGSIVVCEGEHGWDDYLLLHHFDPAEALDKLA